MLIRIVRDDRGWWFVRLTCACGIVRAASAATIKAARWRFRQARREALAAEACR